MESPRSQYSIRINDQWRICFAWSDGLLLDDWKDRWEFYEPDENNLISMPEECVGAVFPGDTVDINDRRWLVVEVYNHWGWPIARVEPAE